MELSNDIIKIVPGRDKCIMDKLKIFAVYLLVLLWFYTGLDKLVFYHSYWIAMHYQIFSQQILTIAIPVLPFLEIAIGLLLIFPKSESLGFLLSFLLMTFFSAYAALVYFGYFVSRPCACAGLFTKLSWGSHLMINLLITLVALFGMIINRHRGKEVEKRF
ncbi:MauE/DoxX family redox-associated membrane protein [Pedobacter agri]|uniref:MauE/DoxX family redox-associated membrane protein n=1 Tax=Pedobacter agri TaxID=454586 RepID=UPI00292FC736|nr:MauE/DoxX family redox-associated membrane protein [Pedobacter agri]